MQRRNSCEEMSNPSISWRCRKTENVRLVPPKGELLDNRRSEGNDRGLRLRGKHSTGVRVLRWTRGTIFTSVHEPRQPADMTRNQQCGCYVECWSYHLPEYSDTLWHSLGQCRFLRMTMGHVLTLKKVGTLLCVSLMMCLYQVLYQTNFLANYVLEMKLPFPADKEFYYPIT